MNDSKIEEMRDFITKIERIIGGEFHSNPNEYKIFFEDKKGWKYPLNYKDKEFKKQKETHIIDAMTIDDIVVSYYTLGSNHLYIGKAIIKLMEHLEERYNIDLLELERKYLSNKKS
jgi:hypothetical protein